MTPKRAHLLIGVVVVALVVTACNPETAPGTTGPTSSPAAASPARTSGAAPTSSPEPSLPLASLDPSMSAYDLLAEDDSIVLPTVVELARETRGAATIRDITFAGSRGDAVKAYLVTPATGKAHGGVLFLHWLGGFDSNREEFLDEAVALAANGLESLLLEQTFPWTDRPSGLEHDRVAIGHQARDAERAVAILRSETRPGKLAVVGHDYGGMYGALLRGLDQRVGFAVIMASTGAWADWFVPYAKAVPPADEAAYRAGLADLDPVTWLVRPSAGRVLFQFASFDAFVPTSAADALATAAGPLAESRTYPAGHELDDTARSERDAWLLDQLAPGEGLTVGIENGTSLVLTLTVNGQVVGTFAPDSGIIGGVQSRLPALPWDLRALSASGREVLSLQVDHVDAGTTVGSQAFLSCGPLYLWAGASEPFSRPPPPTPAPTAGPDCDP